jgi:exodeoxyribonuclease V beta subunit
LTNNYRSTDTIVEAYNHLFADAPEPFFSSGIHYRDGVQARAGLVATQCGEALCPVDLVLAGDADEKLDAQGRRQRLLPWIAAEIDRLLSNPIVLDDGIEPRPLHAGDIFILTRTTNEAVDVAETLRRRGIPCSLYKQEGLFGTPEAHDIRDLLAAIADPHQRSARLLAWRGAFFDVELGDLQSTSEPDEQSPLSTRLYDWKALADRLAYEELFTDILAHSGVIERSILIYGDERRITNILHIFELLGEEMSRSRADIRELIRVLDAWMEKSTIPEVDDYDIQRLDNLNDSVQIMTVHKSKGLEAGVVFLYGGFSTFPSLSPVRIYHDDHGNRRAQLLPLSEAVKKKVRAEADAEDQRLIYVGVTRAIAKLYLPYFPNKSDRIGGYYQFLNRRLSAAAEELPTHFRVRHAHSEDDKRALAHGGLAGWQPLTSSPTMTGNRGAVVEARGGFSVSSYTQLKQRHTDLDDKSDLFDRAQPAEGELPGGAASGIYIHELLELVSFEAIRGSSGVDDFAAREDTHRLLTQSMRRHRTRLSISTRSRHHRWRRAVETCARWSFSTRSRGTAAPVF